MFHCNCNSLQARTSAVIYQKRRLAVKVMLHHLQVDNFMILHQYWLFIYDTTLKIKRADHISKQTGPFFSALLKLQS